MSAIHYEVVPFNLHAHLYRVRCRVDQPDPAGQCFAMPAWIRGSYRVRDFARHVVSLSACCGDQPVPYERIDKSRLRCAPCTGALTLEYTVYARDPSVREAWLDAERGFFNGTSLFYRVEGQQDRPCELLLAPPKGGGAHWRVATALDAADIDGEGFGLYRARNYEELIDHPVEMGLHRRIDFEVDGIPHALVLSGRCDSDEARLTRDLTAICHAERALFRQQPDGDSGLSQYLFLCHVLPKGYGGLEHRASSALVCSRDALPRVGDTALRNGYRDFLGLVSHEYFHLWNVKRITPSRFVASDLGAEAYTRDLWAYEGITSYYDDLMLLRAGRVDAPAYLDLLARTATRMQRFPGHTTQSLAEASFETWIKTYQPDENTANASVSYYRKGALAALCLDLHLRLHSERTLDDVMRGLWARYGQADNPAPEGALEKMAAELSGLDLGDFFDHALRSTKPLSLQVLLKDFGVQAVLRPRVDDKDAGGRVEGDPVKVEAGLSLRATDGVIDRVRSDSAAERAGLAAGDTLVALDGLRVEAGAWSQLLATLKVGQAYALHYFRGDELRETLLAAAPPLEDTWTLTLAEADDDVLARRQAWLGG